MRQIPSTQDALVLRTDFSDPVAWERICATIREPVGDFHFLAYVEFLDDVQYADITTAQLLSLIPRDYNHSFIIIADKTAMLASEHPLLIVALNQPSGGGFRAIPTQIQSIENNLSIANMDFEEFAASVDEDGIFRGFPES